MEGAERQASQSSQPSQVSSEQAKWKQMMDEGIARYMREHPDRFHRRVRRGIPPEFRWRVWKAAVRLDDAWPSVDYHSLCEKETQWTPSIVMDVTRTFPDVKAFDDVQQQRLKRVLNAYASCNPEIGYCQGMNYVAGLLLLVSHNEEESFFVFTQLMEHEDFGLAGFYVGKSGLSTWHRSSTWRGESHGEPGRLPLLRRYLRACESLVADTLPELREHFIKQSVQPAVCARFRGAFDRVGSGCFGATRVKRPSGPKDLV
ncbi:unnamed protein product [Durusdinium trenchii]|uniref:Rab-GAP TBC domain-containing protein n=1 Tax=Durusdinium trenchii TaxID=1381693 RepID=A0ABP0NRV7_9DINO